MRKKGVALIVVLVIVILFSALILAVVLSATMAIRKAHYYTDKTIALEIAESGLNQILYKMNYEKYGNGPGHYYPFGTNPAGQDLSSSPPSIPDYYPPSGAPVNLSYIAYDTDIDTSHLGPQAECYARLVDVNLNVSDPTSYDTDLDLLIVTGKYKGKTAKIMCRIRGANQAGGDLDGTNYNLFSPARTQGSCGVSEAFNKHTIYATLTNGNSTEVKGNITTCTAKPSPFPWTDATWTETTNTSIPVLSNDYKPSDPTTLEPSKPTPSWDKKFKDDDGSDGGTGTYTAASSSYETTLPPGVSYSGNGINETYTIDGALISENWIFEKADTSSTLTVKIEGNTNLATNFIIKAGKDGASPTEDADIILDFSGTNNPNLQGKIVAERNIEIISGVSTPNNVGTTGDLSLWAGDTITIDYSSNQGPTINGDVRGNDIVIRCGGNRVVINGNVYGANTITFGPNANTLDGITINGDVIGINGLIFDSNNNGKNAFYSLVTKNNLTIPNNSNFSLSVDATSSNRKAGILVYQGADAILSLNIQSDIDINVGENQVCGIMVYFEKQGDIENNGKTSNISISGGINFSDSENNKFLIVNNSDDGSIVINAPGKLINGSIYSAFYKDSTPTIVLTNGDINGSIITNGTVNLNGGRITFAPYPYKNAVGDVYKGFVSGRRVYLPVPGSWRIEW